MLLLRLYLFLRHEALSAWQEAEPDIIRILAHLMLYTCASLCLALALVITRILLSTCDYLFGEHEFFVRTACLIGEVIIYIYITRFP
jgi:hypothetical protein